MVRRAPALHQALVLLRHLAVVLVPLSRLLRDDRPEPVALLAEGDEVVVDHALERDGVADGLIGGVEEAALRLGVTTAILLPNAVHVVLLGQVGGGWIRSLAARRFRIAAGIEPVRHGLPRGFAHLQLRFHLRIRTIGHCHSFYHVVDLPNIVLYRAP